MQQQYYPQPQPFTPRHRKSIIGCFIKGKIRVIIGGLAGLAFGFIIAMVIAGCLLPFFPPEQTGNPAAVFIVIIILVFAILSAFSSRYCLFCIVSAFCAAISFIIPYFVGKLYDIYGYTSALAAAAFTAATMVFFFLLIFMTRFFWRLLRVHYFKDYEKPEKTVMGPIPPVAVDETFKRFGQRTKIEDYEPKKYEQFAPSAPTPTGCCPNCGNKINSDDSFCQKCGTKIIVGGESWE